jgi:AP-3 complex subunit mu
MVSTFSHRLPTATPAPFSSPIPWRKAGLRYNNNEIYFDIMEELNAVISKYRIFLCHTVVFWFSWEPHSD